MSVVWGSMTLENQSPECVGTDYLAPLACSVCGKLFEPVRVDQVNCSRACNTVKKMQVRDAKRAELKTLHTIGKNIAFRHFNRDRYLSFDGKYEGPLNKCDTRVEVLKKDQGYRPMPIDVHVRPVKPKFNNVTPDDVDWATKQRAFPHSLSMPRVANNHCAVCTDAVVDASRNEVRVTRGVYLSIEHECPRVRVYDLQGKLLEVIQ